jgi:death-on-curing protein
MRYLTLGEVVALHRSVVAATGGADGIRDLGGLESALAQPKATFGGVDLYPNIVDKASALAFSLAMNHPFVDGNKRIAHAAMSVFLAQSGGPSVKVTMIGNTWRLAQVINAGTAD